MPPRLTNREWWIKRIDILRERADEVKQIEPEIVYDKSGFWPAIKLVFLQYALGFYAPIMRKQRDGGNWKRLHFIDLCGGSGLTRLHAKQRPGSITVAGTALVGAYEQVFDHHHFVEPLPNEARALEKRLAAVLREGCYTVHQLPRDDAVQEIAATIAAEPGNAHFMAFVDPEGFKEITLPQLQPLFDLGRGDFLFNYQYMGVRRAPDAATAFFGSDAWQACDSEEQLRQFFLHCLHERGRPKSLTVKVAAGKGSGRYAYDMVYAVSKTQGDNPWLRNLRNEIEGRCEGVDGTILEDWILGGQQTLF